MSIPEYRDGKYLASWDFECPLCQAMWNNDGDPMGEGEDMDEDCPGCGAELIVTCSYSVDYDVNVKLKPTEVKP
jgi:transcription elongation factor Elf1